MPSGIASRFGHGIRGPLSIRASHSAEFEHCCTRAPERNPQLTRGAAVNQRLREFRIKKRAPERNPMGYTRTLSAAHRTRDFLPIRREVRKRWGISHKMTRAGRTSPGPFQLTPLYAKFEQSKSSSARRIRTFDPPVNRRSIPEHQIVGKHLVSSSLSSQSSRASDHNSCIFELIFHVMEGVSR